MPETMCASKVEKTMRLLAVNILRLLPGEEGALGELFPSHEIAIAHAEFPAGTDPDIILKKCREEECHGILFPLVCDQQMFSATTNAGIPHYVIMGTEIMNIEDYRKFRGKIVALVNK